MSNIQVFTSGSCKGQQPNNRGGYGAIITDDDQNLELSQGYKDTSDKRMELRGAIAGLSALKPHSTVTIYCSNYIHDSITKGWLNNWKRNNWRNNSGKRIKNIPLWEELLSFADQHEIEWLCANNHLEIVGNEQAKKLADDAAKSEALLKD